MNGLKLVNGDLSLGGSGEFATVRGTERIKQQLISWLFEPIGSDPNHPGFGSKIPMMVGQAIQSDTTDLIEAEVSRVVGNYVAYQTRVASDFQLNHSTADFIHAYSPDDIIVKVDKIDVRRVDDSIFVRVSVTTAAGTGITVAQALTGY